MRRVRSTTGQFSEEMQDLGRRIAEAYGITPLRPNEHRPPGYYLRNPFRFGFRRRKLPPPKDFGTTDER